MEQQKSESEPSLSAESPKIKQRIRQLFSPWLKLPLKNRIIILSVVGFFLIAATGTALKVLIKDPEVKPVGYIAPPKPKEPEPTTAPSPLTGVEVDIPLSKLPVTGVMIENSPDARPQSGLGEAGAVFEAIAEGGITRFLALYQESQPGSIGPVRSVRPYYLDFLQPFDAPIAHAGGSAVALDQIRRQGIKDLDWAHNPNYYQRVTTRYAPHNLYTSRKQMLELHNAKGFKTSKFNGYERKEEEPAKKPDAASLNFEISSFLYNSQYTYDKKSNSYKRNLAGKPHVDEKSGKQITPKVVIAIETTHGYDGIYSTYKTTGEGKVTVFQDGTATTGTWRKKNRTSPYVFQTKAGETLKLNPGMTWITLIPGDRYSFSP